MRRYSSVIMIGLGSFLMVAALLVRFYAYPHLAVAPIEQDSITRLSATDATLLDTSTLAPITTDLDVAVRTVGDVKATEAAADDVRVWYSTTSVRSDDGQVRSRSVDRAAFGAVSGAAVNCCREWRSTTAGELTPVQRKGQVFKFPFHTLKQDYPNWDSTVGKEFNAKYVGTDSIQGMGIYKFVMTIPDTLIDSRELPASIFGIDQAEPVNASVFYRNTKTFYVEPETGAIIDRTEDQKQWLVAEGTEVVANQALLSFTDAQVTKMVSDVESDASMLGNLRTLYPLLIGLLGLGLFAAGVLLRVRRGSGTGSGRRIAEPPAVTAARVGSGTRPPAA